MIILVVSDTHDDLKNASLAIKHTMKTGLDIVIHCGDHIDDARRLEKMFPQIKFYAVPGNCDGWFFKKNEKTKVLKVLDKKILFTHGDTYNIKFNYNQIFKAAQKTGAVLALCGHTHMAYIEERKSIGITAVNPGSISFPRDSKYPSYSILKLDKGQEIKVEMMLINNGKIIKNPFFK